MPLNQFVVLLQEHPNLGLLAYPYFIKKEHSGFKINERIMLSKLNTLSLNETQEQIVKISEKYSDSEILKLFSKKKSSIKDFYLKLDASYANTHIKPYIERQLNKIFLLLLDSDVALFKRKKNESQLYSSNLIRLMKDDSKVTFNFIKDEIGLNYYITIFQNNVELNLHQKQGLVMVNEPCWIILEGKLFHFPDIDGKKLTPFFTKSHVSINKEHEKKYFETFILTSIKKYRVNNRGFDILTVNPKKSAILIVEDNLKGETIFRLSFTYDEFSFDYKNPKESKVWLHTSNDNYTFYRFYRDFEWEESFRHILEKTGLMVNNSNQFFIVSEIATELQKNKTISWLNNNEENLKKSGLVIKQDFFKKKYFTEKITLDLSIINETDWFDVNGFAYFGEFKIPFVKLRRNILNGIPEYTLPNGEIAVLPEEWFSKYANIFKFSLKGKDGIKLNKFHSLFIDSSIIPKEKNSIEKYRQLFDNVRIKNYPIPESLNAKLRSYQHKGYSWLNHLKEYNFGACLADDMGLGKTIQTIALLLAAKYDETEIFQPELQPIENKQLEIFSSNITGQNNAKNNLKTSLIVVPVSLVHNWINEINRFAPELSTFSFLNTNRTRNLNDLKDYDVVITTYGIIRNDIDILSYFRFHYIVLDESQNIKNPASKTYKAVSQLNSAHKIVLTGTPIENSLTDLWSQINFINRGLLGSLSFFKEEFQKPIEKLNSETHKEKLNKLIHPFILRRTKEEVVKELPPVNNQTLVCTMSPEQKSYYEKEKSKIRNTILHDIDAKGIGNTAINILQALSKLRQISIHPKLIDQNYEFDSGKFDQITQDIENVIAENHKILVFSSYVKHLNLIAAYLKENKVNYALLTGDIDQKKREHAINEFKENEKTPVFLISLKAGGTGLNLTQADYVFIIDPWWNPAAEWQAISRAHRIGQDKKVFVYRYISAGTVEEKITLLQEKKTKLADLFINSNNPFQSLSKSDIEELFD